MTGLVKMKNLQTKNIFITVLTVLIVSVAFARPIVQLKNNSDFSSKLYSLKAPDTNFLLLKVSESKGDLPQTPQNTPFENKNDDDIDSDDDDVYDRFCYIFHSLIERLNSSTVSFEIADSSRSVFVPLYILFHSWKNFLL